MARTVSSTRLGRLQRVETERTEITSGRVGVLGKPGSCGGVEQPPSAQKLSASPPEPKEQPALSAQAPLPYRAYAGAAETPLASPRLSERSEPESLLMSKPPQLQTRAAALSENAARDSNFYTEEAV
jgi:hypothetical protein